MTGVGIEPTTCGLKGGPRLAPFTGTSSIQAPLPGILPHVLCANTGNSRPELAHIFAHQPPGFQLSRGPYGLIRGAAKSQPTDYDAAHGWHYLLDNPASAPNEPRSTRTYPTSIPVFIGLSWHTTVHTWRRNTSSSFHYATWSSRRDPTLTPYCPGTPRYRSYQSRTREIISSRGTR